MNTLKKGDLVVFTDPEASGMVVKFIGQQQGDITGAYWFEWLDGTGGEGALFDLNEFRLAAEEEQAEMKRKI